MCDNCEKRLSHSPSSKVIYEGRTLLTDVCRNWSYHQMMLRENEVLLQAISNFRVWQIKASAEKLLKDKVTVDVDCAGFDLNLTRHRSSWRRSSS